MQIARMLKLAKDSAVKTRTQAVNQLKAVLVTTGPVAREELAGLKESRTAPHLRTVRRSQRRRR
ncbi:hypothetical protein [Streptomyces nigrescens]|uniref:hypothetical protein n=1 Tax=Streptomyces nigrescens TaxID=1920 RepID=UPI003829BD69